jgi:protein-tyrosine phosphatase
VEVERVKVCFVCSGNICRSPTAEAIMKDLVDRAHLGDWVHVESAGTSAYREGAPRDERSAATAVRRGLSLDGSARLFRPADFRRFDHVLAMDERNRTELIELARTPEDRGKVELLRDFEGNPSERSVPDPYHGGEHGFDEVFEICEAACRGLLSTLISRRDRQGREI